MVFRTTLLLSVTALASCLAAEVQSNSVSELAAANTVTTSTVINTEIISAPDYDNSADLALFASPERIRMAGFYQLEWAVDEPVCAAALTSLNKPYAVPDNLRTSHDINGKPLGLKDYASHQAAYYLGTNDNVRWSWRTIEVNRGFEAEVAFIDFFNDGIDRLIIRERSLLADNSRVTFSVRNAAGADPIFDGLSYGLTGEGLNDLPDREDLDVKLEYSVKDLIKLDDRYYTLLTPLHDFDESGRVYLAAWRAAPEVMQWRRGGDYYPDLLCTFTPADTQTEDGR